MRAAVPALLAALLLAPTAAAEFGPYGEDGWPVDVLGESTNPAGVAPGGAAAAGPLNVAGPLTVYPYYPLLTAEVQRLAQEHPDLVRLHSAGTSTAGLDLWMLEIADFARIDGGEGLPLDQREVVWVDGGTHSNEYSGVYFVAHLASFLLDEHGTNETATWIVENRHTWLMPMVNPDGSHAFGRLNANLVNINRNYPVVWDGEGHDALMNNRGPHPASEPETRANIEWLNKTRPDYYASVHCCGNLWLYPYGEEGVDPVDNAVLSRVCDEAFPTVREDCGPIWSTIYPASGSSVDTAYEFTGAVAFGYEMSGRGAVALWGQPFTDRSVREQEVESWNGVMHAFLNVHRYGARPVVADARVEDGALLVTVRNDGWGNLTAGNLTRPGGGAYEGNLAIDFAEATMPLPPLAPGESATVRVPGPLVARDLPLTLSYAKRTQAAPVGEAVETLRLAQAPDGALRVVAIGGQEVVPLSDEGAAPVPGAPVAAALLAAVAVALLRRR